MEIHKPIEINADKRNGMLKIIWDDQHESPYPFSLLRAACPCVECRGGHANMHAKPDPNVFDQPLTDSPATRMDSINAVGAYGISVRWQDGHDFGVYTWSYLRALCPCPVCRAQNPEQRSL
jgi:DUF971 family protein